MKKAKKILLGIILVAVGVLIALKAVNVIDFEIFFDGWWTLFIIVPCFIGLFTEQDKLGNLVGLALGVSLLLACQDVIGFGMIWKLLIPLVIIIEGIKLICRGIRGNKISKAIVTVEGKGEGMRNTHALFGGSDVIVDKEVFEGARLSAIFGGIEYDLRNAVIEKDCVIKVAAVFGGIDILVPPEVNVVTDTTCIFGGIDSKTVKRADVPTIYVTGACVFGGVDIKY